MIDPHRFFLFLGAATLLAVAPGPEMLYVVARTLAGGRHEGALSRAETFLGGLVHAIPAATGLSMVLATSATAFRNRTHTDWLGRISGLGGQKMGKLW